MRVKHNITLLIIVVFLLIAITEITGLPEKHITEQEEEIQLSEEINNLGIVWDVSADFQEQNDKSNQEILNNIVDVVPESVNLSLRPINQQGLQGEQVFVLNMNNGSSLTSIDQVDKLSRTEYSSIAQSLVQTGIDLISREGEDYVLLITDRESGDQLNDLPSRAANRLRKHNIRTYVLQLGEPEEELSKELKLTAELGGGEYFSYSDKDRVIPVMTLLER
ncbi:hypothetical protein [Fuchsiella alkaliacetigena]|uniref:hypothetical protein n=1 Tax=Fuchsiella alkaliacetigena TaxID=957042 RepID=UPI00200A460A|nr:hypothetical protein [Fuchsiella alkaliacetigena]MCK8823741.1 hypothetical protein [Fuchsiella alkaliacetigena]